VAFGLHALNYFLSFFLLQSSLPSASRSQLDLQPHAVFLAVKLHGRRNSLADPPFLREPAAVPFIVGAGRGARRAFLRVVDMDPARGVHGLREGGACECGEEQRGDDASHIESFQMEFAVRDVQCARHVCTLYFSDRTSCYNCDVRRDSDWRRGARVPEGGEERERERGKEQRHAQSRERGVARGARHVRDLNARAGGADVGGHAAGRRWHIGDAIGAHAAAMDYLNPEQQVFVYQQIRNWVFGRHAVFHAVNLAWSTHGAQAYFWD
jgi:hypothetical protein